ncbi:putative membrane protein [Streptococcus pneumoniae GA44511]|nr:putative membrane protein [Streptococcus pneumoniae GA44511]
MGYLDTEAIILAVFSFAFYNLCSFAWVCSTIKTIKIK